MAAEIAPRPSDDIAGLRNDLEAEQRCLVDDLRGVEADDWFTVTAAEGWDVRDTVAHLADTDEIAIDTCTDGPRSLTRLATALASAEDVTLWGVLEGRRQPGPEVLAWWEDAHAEPPRHPHGRIERRQYRAFQVLRVLPPCEHLGAGLASTLQHAPEGHVLGRRERRGEAGEGSGTIGAGVDGDLVGIGEVRNRVADVPALGGGHGEP